MNITKRKPTHPGKMFLETVIKPLNLTITETAKYLKITPKTLSLFVNEKQSLSTAMAIKIALFTKTTPESWLDLQTKLNLWEVMQREQPRIIYVYEIPKRVSKNKYHKDNSKINHLV